MAQYDGKCNKVIQAQKQVNFAGLLNYQMRSDVSQNAIICIQQIKNLCDNYHVSISVVDENINEDASSRQSTCSLLYFLYFPVY